jgi:hypothetical protein
MDGRAEAGDEGRAEGTSAVGRDGERQARLVDAPVVGGVDHEVGEEEGEVAEVERRIHLPPARAQVVGAKEGGGLALDQGVDHVGPRRRHRHRDAALLGRRQALAQLAPGVAAVGRLVEDAPRAAGAVA